MLFLAAHLFIRQDEFDFREQGIVVPYVQHKVSPGFVGTGIVRNLILAVDELDIGKVIGYDIIMMNLVNQNIIGVGVGYGTHLRSPGGCAGIILNLEIDIIVLVGP
jgi:hypothetical protein